MKPAYLIVLFLSLTICGCGQGDPLVVDKALDPTHGNFIQISAAYRQYCNDNGKGLPSDKEFLVALAKEGKPDEILKGRDGQPVVVCYGVNMNEALPWAKTVGVLAYEKQGVGGKRMVLSTAGSISEMDDAEFKAASFPPGHKPPT